MPADERLKKTARAAIEEAASADDGLVALSLELHARPEIGFQERHAAARVAELLERYGLRAVRGAYGVETAVEGRAASSANDRPVVAFLAEYDALPGIGHGCGHNLIAAAACGAGLGVRAALESGLAGEVRVLGTPAEEGGGGKIVLIENGAFRDVDAVLMVHPCSVADARAMNCLATATVDVRYTGLAAHAAAAPWEGRNALDAMVLGYMALAAMRQHIPPEARIHGVFLEAGQVPNVVPERTVARYTVRHATVRALAGLRERVESALRAGAAAAGCEVEVRWLERPYADLARVAALEEAYERNARALGRDFLDEGEVRRRFTASTDLGNVSQVVAAIHPMVAITRESPALHTAAFAEAARSREAQDAMIQAAVALAWTALDYLADAGLRERTRREHAAATRE